MRRLTLVLVAAGSLVPAAHADVNVGLHVRVAPGVSIGARWRAVPPRAEVAPSADLAVVDTDVHPKHARLYLDGRFIGIADDFDGFPGFLYLEPGRYRLECRLGGFRDEVVEIDARAGYRHDLDFRLQRSKGEKKEHWWQAPERPRPVPRVYGPVVANPLGQRLDRAGSRAPAGPDLRLRPDLGRDKMENRSQSEQPGAGSLRVVVRPLEASVYLDGAFLAAGAELAGLTGPLAVASGRHEVEVMAPGYVAQRRVIEVVSGATVELNVELLPARGRQGETR